MTEAQATRKLANAMRDLLLVVKECEPHLSGVASSALRTFVKTMFLPFAETVEMSARRLEEKEADNAQ